MKNSNVQFLLRKSKTFPREKQYIGYRYIYGSGRNRHLIRLNIGTEENFASYSKSARLAFMTCSRASALLRSPDSFSFPDMKAVAGFSSRLNICNRPTRQCCKQCFGAGLDPASVSSLDPDPHWIRLQSGQWIRIRNLDPDLGGQK